MQEVSSIKFTTFLGTESEFKLNTDGQNFDVTIVSKNIFQRMYNQCSGKDWSTTTKISNSNHLLREELPAAIQKVVDEYASTYPDFTHFDELKKMMSPRYFQEKQAYQSIIDETFELLNLIQYTNRPLHKSLESKFNFNRERDYLKFGRSDLQALKQKISGMACNLITEIGFVKSFEICSPFNDNDEIGIKVASLKSKCENLDFTIPIKMHKTHETLRNEIKNMIFQIGNFYITIDEDNKSDLIDILEATTSDKKMNANEVESLAKKLLKSLEKLKTDNPSTSSFINLRIEDLKKLAREVGINLDR